MSTCSLTPTPSTTKQSHLTNSINYTTRMKKKHFNLSTLECTMQPESEIIRFFQTWIIIYTFLTYSFLIGKLVSPGKIRFLLILPVVLLFLLIPLRITSINLGGITSFFISWLATFKLILFSFNRGPLITPTSLIPFLSAASLPIRITPRSKLDRTPDATAAAPTWSSAKQYAVKVGLIAVVFKLFSVRDRLPQPALLILYCFHIYLLLELFLVIIGAAARAGLGLELEPQFNEPYLATSLRDFWGRRWNLVVNGILRPTVYEPMVDSLTGPLGRIQAQSLAILATFGVSGIMHQMIIYHLTNLYPTWEMASFFMLHGVCVVAETALSRRLNVKWRLPWMVSSSLTVLFVMSTAFCLFFPEILHGKLDVRSFQEYATTGEFVRSVINGTLFRSFNGIPSIQHFFQQVLLFQ